MSLWIKSLPGTTAYCMHASVLAAPLLFQLSASDLGKQQKTQVLRALLPTCKTWMKLLAPGFDQLWPLQLFSK